MKQLIAIGVKLQLKHYREDSNSVIMGGMWDILKHH